MKTIPAALILEKNKIATTSAWIILAEVTFVDGTIVRLARNTEDITFETHVFTAFPFELDTIGFDQGRIPSVVLKINNTTRLIQYYLEDSNGAIGATVRLIVVNSTDYTADLSDLELTFQVTESSADVDWVYFTLSIPSPLNKRFPLYRYIANHCNWVGNFKGVECQYAGVVATCDGTLASCKALGNSAHYGGFIGLGKGGIRFV
jgi:phage-related protein